MSKRKIIFSVLGALLMLSACVPVATTPTASNPVVVVETTAISTTEPQVIYVTATYEAPTVPSLDFATPTPEGGVQEVTIAAPVSTDTPVGGEGIIIKNINDLGNEKAMVHWEAHGTFASGFKVVWSSEHELPTYPEDTSSYYRDPSARAGQISGEYGKIYYVRVCRLINDTCDMYSNVFIYGFVPPTPTATIYFATRTATKYSSSGSSSSSSSSIVGNTSYNAAGTPISATSVIAIVKMKDAGTGKAYIEWTASASPADGFRIVYSKSDTTPTDTDNKFYAIDKGSTRYAYVDGTPGTKYYYRVCRVVETDCDIYSNTYTFTFGGNTPTPTAKATTDISTITISGFTDLTTGSASLAWTVSGSFPDGFRVLYSYANNPPTMSDTVATVSSSAARSVTVYGIPGVSYFFKVCKVVSSSCTIYSSVVSYVFAAEITLNPTSGATGVDLAWTDAASTPPATGYIILRANGTTDPIKASTLASVNNATFVYIDTSAVSGNTYTYRICGFDDPDMTSCSLPETISYTAP